MAIFQACNSSLCRKPLAAFQFVNLFMGIFIWHLVYSLFQSVERKIGNKGIPYTSIIFLIGTDLELWQQRQQAFAHCSLYQEYFWSFIYAAYLTSVIWLFGVILHGSHFSYAAIELSAFSIIYSLWRSFIDSLQAGHTSASRDLGGVSGWCSGWREKPDSGPLFFQVFVILELLTR